MRARPRHGADSRQRHRARDPADKKARLFQPFERLGAELSTVEGTGLGLAVSKGLTEAMGGRIGFESTVDVGTTFWVELPYTAAPAPRHVEEPAAAQGRLKPPAGRSSTSKTTDPTSGCSSACSLAVRA